MSPPRPIVKIVVVLMFLAVRASAQYDLERMGFVFANQPKIPTPQEEARARLEETRKAAGELTVREVGGKFYDVVTNSAWMTVPREGYVLSVYNFEREGMVFEADNAAGIFEGFLWVRNYPTNKSMVRGATVPAFRAMKIGETNWGGFAARVLDYGRKPVPTAAQLKALEAYQVQQKIIEGQKQSAARTNLVAWQKAEAEAGNARQQYNLGVRFLNGEGVAKDRQTAREWFAKAAAAGDPDARAALEKLPQN